MARDYYEILGVDRRANDADIKKAYRALARKYHPDVSQEADAETLIKEINEAYQVLSDPEKRARYDRFGHAGVNMGSGAGGFSDFGDINDIFEDLMGAFTGRRSSGGGGGAGNRRRARQGRDLRYDLNISFEQAVFGADIDVTIARQEICETCHGSKAEPGTQPVTCPECKGSGQIRQMRQMFIGNVVMASDCPRCHGEGQIVEHPCHTCHGKGRVRKERILTVNVPAGVDHETQIRLSGQGEPGENGGPPGNLYVVLNVEPHEYFKRRGTDILLEYNINVAQAALGDTVEVPTVEDPETIKIAPGTQTGTVIRLKNKGVPKLRPDGTSSGRGEQLVIINVMIPQKLTPEQKEMFEALGRSLGTQVTPPSNSNKGFFDRVASLFGVD